MNIPQSTNIGNVGIKQLVVLELCENFRSCTTKRALLNRLLDGVIKLGHARARLWLYEDGGTLRSFGCRGPHSQQIALDNGEIKIHDDDTEGNRVLKERRTIRYRYQPLPYHKTETAFPWVDVIPASDSFHAVLDKSAVNEWTETPLFFAGDDLGKLTVDNQGSLARFEDVDVMLIDHMASVASTVLQYLEIVEKHRQAQAHYASFVEKFPFCVFTKDTDGRFTFANSTLMNHFGVKLPTEILGKKDEDFFPIELVRIYELGDNKAIIDGFYEDKNEPFIVPKTKDKLTIHVIKVPITDNSGQVIGIQGAFWDVSDRTLALVETQVIARVGSWIWSPSTDRIEASDELYAIFGIDLKNRKITLTQMREKIYKPDLPVWDAGFQLAQQAKPIEAELRIQTKTGLRWVFTKSEVSLRSEMGLPLKVIGIVQDIDRVKRSQDILARAAIACTGVHNLKDPITILRNSVEVLKNQNSEDTKLFADLGQIERHATRFVENIDHLIHVFKKGKPALKLERVLLNEYLQARIVRARVEAEKKDVLIIENHTPNPPVVVADLVLIRHVFENLFENAIRHTPKDGAIYLSVDKSKTEVFVTILNTGPAFSADVISDFKVSCSPKNPSGTGLGLLISKAILELHDGTMTIDNIMNENRNRPIVTIRFPYESN